MADRDTTTFNCPIMHQSLCVSVKRRGALKSRREKDVLRPFVMPVSSTGRTTTSFYHGNVESLRGVSKADSGLPRKLTVKFGPFAFNGCRFTAHTAISVRCERTVGMLASPKRPRTLREEEEHIDWAIANSLAAASEPERHVKDDVDLDLAIAQSLAEDASERDDALLSIRGSWHCVQCTLVNKAESGRCDACQADREAPFAAAFERNTSAGYARPQRCGLPGCTQERQRHGFCSEDHKQRAERRGLLAPECRGVERVFRGATGEYACDLLTKESPERAGVIEQFGNAWRKPGAVPRVERVYAVRPPPALSERFARHARAVGNIRRRFHGTGAECDFAVDLNRAPCTSASCALCSILGCGFRLAHAGTGPNAGNRATLRYGRGLYFSSTSGKSNDYAMRSERIRSNRRWRTMFVASVAAGRAYRTEEGELDVSKAPDGYDSIVGEVGANLNYDELVVYNEAAALPEFLIVYSAAQ